MANPPSHQIRGAPSLEALLDGHREPFDWREYYHALRDRLWIPILCLVLALVAATVFLVNSTPVYRSRSVLFMEQERARVLNGMEGVRDYEIRSLDMVLTVVDLLGSYTFAQRTAERLGLGKNKEFLAAVGLGNEEISAAQAAGLIFGEKMLSTKFREETRLIDITFTTKDPKLSTWLANSWAEEYLRYLFERRNEATIDANRFLIDEAARLRKKLRVSEEGMQSFREREQTASFDSLMSEAQKRLDATSERIGDIEKKIFQITTDLNIAGALPENLDALLLLPSIAAEPTVAKRTENVVTLNNELSLLAQRYRPKHPAYISIQARLDLAKADQAEAVQRALGLLDSSREGMKTQLGEIEKVQKQEQKRLLQITGSSIDFNELQRELETDKSLYEAVIARIKEVDVTKGLEDLPVEIHERATGASPVVPNAILTLLLAAFGGVTAGAGLALGLHFLDHSFRTVEQLESGTGMTCLCAIPKIKFERGTHNIPCLSDHSGEVAESIRTLRAALALAPGARKQTYLFTSCYPGEGKTFTSSNFAATLALQGLRTAIVDVDLRKPDVSKTFFGTHRRPGLSEVLLGKAELKETYQPTEHEKLTVIPAGGRLTNPAEVLSTADLTALIDTLLKDFDRVVFDTAPLLAVSDTLMLASHVDMALLVVRAGSTARNAIRRVLSQLEGVNALPPGLIMNQLPHGRGGYYSYYYSHGQYGTYGSEGVYGAKQSAA